MERPGPIDLDALIPLAHEARAAHRFAEAYEALSRADQHGDLSTDDILAWADAAKRDI